jgi:hypothetical protein
LPARPMYLPSTLSSDTSTWPSVIPVSSRSSISVGSS